MKKKYYHIISFVLGTALTCLITACEGQDEDSQGTDDNTTYAVNFEIGTQTETNTRATVDNPTNNAEQAESMKSVLLVVVKADNTIEAIIEEDFGDTDAKTAYQEIAELTAGPKTLYGFANLTAEMLNEASLDNNSLTVGSAFPAAVADALCNTAGRNGNYIPMSNKQEITVTKLPGQKYIIELIRLMCKITFTVKNESGYGIELRQIVTNPVTTLDSPVYLLPHTRNGGDCVLPGEAKTDSIVWAWPATDQKLSKDATSSEFTIYLNESKVANDGWFTFQLNTLKEEKLNYDRFSISNTRALNRNDHLPVNITLTDFNLKLDVQSYPPIGGYPSVDVPMKDKEYYAHFPGGGPFIITPHLSKYSTGEEVTEGVTWTLSMSGALSIFDVQPTLKNNEIIGTLKYAPSKAGEKALCTLTGIVKVSETVERRLTYKIYVENYD